MTSLAGRVLATIRRRSLFPDGAKVVAAVSGGSDSVALAYLLAELSASRHLQLVGVAHVNHRLRGADSDRDAAFCARVASDCGVPLDVEECEVAVVAARPGRSLEEAAREARYASLERARARCGAEVVAVGHTRDDQAETVLMRLARGAGPRGLTAILPRRGQVVRPLLDLRRADLTAYLETAGRAWVVDGSNEDRGRTRNRLRHDVIPGLVAAEGEGVVDALARTADIARADEALLAALAAAALGRVVSGDGLPVRVDAAGLAAEPLALRRRVLQRLLRDVSGRVPSFEAVESAVRFLERRRPGSLDLPGARVELSAAAGVLINRASRDQPDAPGDAASWRYRLTVPGEVAVREAGVTLRALVEPRQDGPRVADPRQAVLDGGAVGSALVVRAWQPGDRMRLPDGSGRKKVQDLFVDRKVPREARHAVPVVALDSGPVVWVAGHAVAGGFRPTGATKSVVVLSFEPLGGL
jgi:tRNA(Ile)-lysidine synthase